MRSNSHASQETRGTPPPFAAWLAHAALVLPRQLSSDEEGRSYSSDSGGSPLSVLADVALHSSSKIDDKGDQQQPSEGGYGEKGDDFSTLRKLRQVELGGAGEVVRQPAPMVHDVRRGWEAGQMQKGGHDRHTGQGVAHDDTTDEEDESFVGDEVSTFVLVAGHQDDAGHRRRPSCSGQPASVLKEARSCRHGGVASSSEMELPLERHLEWEFVMIFVNTMAGTRCSCPTPTAINHLRRRNGQFLPPGGLGEVGELVRQPTSVIHDVRRGWEAGQLQQSGDDRDTGQVRQACRQRTTSCGEQPVAVLVRRWASVLDVEIVARDSSLCVYEQSVGQKTPHGRQTGPLAHHDCGQHSNATMAMVGTDDYERVDGVLNEHHGKESWLSTVGDYIDDATDENDRGFVRDEASVAVHVTATQMTTKTTATPAAAASQPRWQSKPQSAETVASPQRMRLNSHASQETRGTPPPSASWLAHAALVLPRQLSSDEVGGSYSSDSGGSPLSVLADVTLHSSSKIDDKGDQQQPSEGGDEKGDDFSTLRELRQVDLARLARSSGSRHQWFMTCAVAGKLARCRRVVTTGIQGK
ncbi:hypothetical protein HPB49_020142 [Dermacentor silvarum]|uniref:Uncharacterized protein n=1 Tax=Dermacentor silvarum TaxID=543639 RepID=A0ACB8CAY1_DERSI|nr:hypothetical protein HPB49_020142 [Dermacentor silvarum]